MITDHLLAWIAGLATAVFAATVAALAARVRLLPDVIDISIIPTGAGLGSLAFAFYGAYADSTPTGSDVSRCSAPCWAAPSR